MVATIETPQVQAKDGDVAERQVKDSKLRPMVQYLKNGTLPALKKEAKKVTLTKDWYMLVDNVLYCITMVSIL